MDEYQAQIEAQKELMRAQGDESMRSYLPQLHQQIQEAQAVVLEQINPKKVVAEVLLELSGQEIDQRGDVKRIGKPYLNPEGLRNIKLRMRGIVNQHNIMSFLEDKEIQRLMMALESSLSFDLALNWRNYGIKDRTVCDMIMDTVLINSYTALKRAQEQNEKRFLRGITLESIGGGQRSSKKDKGEGWERFASKLRL